METLEPLLIAIGTTAVAMSIVYMMFNLRSKLRSSRYDEEKQMIELELMRRSLEDKAYSAQERLTADKDRWVEVNHLLLEALRKADKSPEVKDTQKSLEASKFLSDLGVSDGDLKVDRSKVFVLTPFHPRYERPFEIIRSVCSEVGLRCVRGDEEFVRGAVLNHLLKELITANIVIANIDGRNPNVFYELGIAHALDKNVILVSSNVDEVPFDVQSQRLVLWNTSSELRRGLEKSLTQLMVKG